MPPFIPAILLAEPEFLTQPSQSSCCRRLARIDLPAPGPPHIKKKKLTSWNGSNAWIQHSSMILTSPPEILTPEESSSMRKARQWPKGVTSREMRFCLCAKPMLAVPSPAFASFGSTTRPSPTAARFAPISPASRSASLSPVYAMSYQPGGMVRRSRLRSYAL